MTVQTTQLVETTESQKQRILEFLLCGCSLTALEALQHFGCMKTSNRISELREDGWPIKTEMIDTPTHKRIARYSL